VLHSEISLKVYTMFWTSPQVLESGPWSSVWKHYPTYTYFSNITSADQFLSAKVIGTDLSPIQPELWPYYAQLNMKVTYLTLTRVSLPIASLKSTMLKILGFSLTSLITFTIVPSEAASSLTSRLLKAHFLHCLQEAILNSKSSSSPFIAPSTTRLLAVASSARTTSC